eukprot:gene6278-6350_t
MVSDRLFNQSIGKARASQQVALDDALTGDGSRGTNQTGVRLYNERLILSLIRRNTSLSKIEITHLTGLSAQTVSGIVNSLEGNGLLLREAPLRGRVGQPTVPFRINPVGAFSLGLKIGRRSSDFVLINFMGEVLLRRKLTYKFPIPSDVLEFVRTCLSELGQSISPVDMERIAGLGIAAPFELWNWETEVAAPREILDRWRSFDLAAEVAAICQWPVSHCNDATAACSAELIFGQGWKHNSCVYFFIGSFVGGGIVLDGNLYQGRTGYAGALGPMPVGTLTNQGWQHQQLIRHASTYVLENRLRHNGIDPSPIWQTPEQWDGFGETLETWISETGQALAQAIVSAVSVVDFDAAIIDGAIPLWVRHRIWQSTIDNIKNFDLQGTAPFKVFEGSVGAQARAIGGASLPFLENFARDRSVLFKLAES